MWHHKGHNTNFLKCGNGKSSFSLRGSWLTGWATVIIVRKCRQREIKSRGSNNTFHLSTQLCSSGAAGLGGEGGLGGQHRSTMWILNNTHCKLQSRWCEICDYLTGRERERVREREEEGGTTHFFLPFFFFAFESRPCWIRKPTQILSSGDAPLWQTTAGLSSVGFGNEQPQLYQQPPP